MSSQRRKILKLEANRTDRQQKAANALHFVVMPIVIAAAGVATPHVYGLVGYWVLALWSLVLLLHFSIWWWSSPASNSIWKLIDQNEELEEKISDLEDSIEKFTGSLQLMGYSSSHVQALFAMVSTYVANGINSREALSEAVSEMLSPAYNRSEMIFGIGGSERWNFALYLYSARRDALIPVWREKAPQHPSHGPGREWGRGEGHVGKAFVDARIIITPDARGDDVRELSAAPPGKAEPYDDDVYRSFACFPIGPITNGAERPHGVLVATSDRAGRFDRENTHILLQVAHAIAALVVLGRIDVDVLDDT